MPAAIEIRQSEHFPKLGWYASVDTHTRRVAIQHGSAVERGDEWVVEGVWDGPFSEGGFHESENFFGSGVRLDGGDVYFVPSTGLVDRLFYCRYGDRICVSNSLIILLAMTGATLDHAHDYRAETQTILEGLDHYDRLFHILHPTITHFYQLYYDTMVVSDEEMHFQSREKPHEIGSFNDYYEGITGVLRALRCNYEDAARRILLTPFSTLSTGYDSSAVSCLVQDIGVTRCFSYSGAWKYRTQKDPAFDTAPLAKALNLQLIPLGSFRKETSGNELYLYAASPVGSQRPLLAMADYIRDHCPAAVVFTGYYGGNMWNAKIADDYLSERFKRHDVSGIDIAELRLHSGFINVPVPFILAGTLNSVSALSQSAEMAPWRLNNNYDRPVPRRILEEAGVPRQLFGTRKGGLFTRQSQPLDPALRRQYYAFLRGEHGFGRAGFYFRHIFDRLAFIGMKYVLRLIPARRLPRLHESVFNRRRRLGEGESLLWGRINFKKDLHLWAVQVLTSRLKGSMEKPPVRGDSLPPRPADDALPAGRASSTQ